MRFRAGRPPGSFPHLSLTSALFTIFLSLFLASVDADLYISELSSLSNRNLMLDANGTFRQGADVSWTVRTPRPSLRLSSFYI